MARQFLFHHVILLKIITQSPENIVNVVKGTKKDGGSANISLVFRNILLYIPNRFHKNNLSITDRI
jgi:hypothetical protein